MAAEIYQIVVVACPTSGKSLQRSMTQKYSTYVSTCANLEQKENRKRRHFLKSSQAILIKFLKKLDFKDALKRDR